MAHVNIWINFEVCEDPSTEDYYDLTDLLIIEPIKIFGDSSENLADFMWLLDQVAEPGFLHGERDGIVELITSGKWKEYLPNHE